MDASPERGALGCEVPEDEDMRKVAFEPGF